METGPKTEAVNISVYDLLGNRIHASVSRENLRKIKIDLEGNVPGVYFIRFNIGSYFMARKVSYVPW